MLYKFVEESFCKFLTVREIFHDRLQVVYFGTHLCALYLEVEFNFVDIKLLNFRENFGADLSHWKAKAQSTLVLCPDTQH